MKPVWWLLFLPFPLKWLGLKMKNIRKKLIFKHQKYSSYWKSIKYNRDTCCVDIFIIQLQKAHGKIMAEECIKKRIFIPVPCCKNGKNREY